MNVDFDFNTAPIDNVAFMMAKKPELHFDYDEIKFEAHQRAFTIAKVTQIDLLAEIQASLENAFVEGQSFETWRKNLKPTLQKHGWLGQTSVVNPKTGEEKEIFVGAKRLKTIFYTNARTAYAQAEARAGYELKLSEYIRYVAILDNRVRAEHAALHGKIAHRKDKFWETNYPPNGWNCRCSVEFISKDEMDELGWSEMSDIEKTLNYADSDWAYDTRNLKTSYADDLLRLVRNKIKKFEIQKNAAAVEALKELEKNTLLQKGKEDLILRLDELKGVDFPPNLSKDDFLDKEIDEIINKKNLIKHLEKKDEGEGRMNYLNLIEPTRKEPNAILKTKDKNTNELRKTFLKVFENSQKRKFYVFVTDYKDDKIAITGIPMSARSSVKKVIRDALEVLSVEK